jgi:hypothetical protein
MSMESLPFLGFRVLGVDTKNSNPKFTGKYQVFHYTFLFNAYVIGDTYSVKQRFYFWFHGEK